MSTRDELADAIDRADHEYTVASERRDTVANHIADTLIAEGWRKKPDREDIENVLYGWNVSTDAEDDLIYRAQIATSILALMDRTDD